MRTRTLLGPLALTALAACAGAPPTVVTAPVVDTTPAPAPVTLPLGARWVESGGATLVGPSVAEGTLVLLGGRRAVVRVDGALDEEKAPSPEPLLEIVEVPSAKGVRLVGRGAHGVFRFDDPLGAPVVLAHSDEALARLGSGPGVVAVWRGLTELPALLDVETGAAATSLRLPAPPAQAMAFVDPAHGALALEGVGLAVTADGGASWRLVAAEQTGPDALRVRGLRVRHGEIRAFSYADGPDGRVDPDAARVSAFEQERIAGKAAERPLLRWIRGTGRDPLEALASAGVDLPDGRALTASHGLVARVDPRTGAVEALVDLAHGRATGPCGVGRTGQTAWIACSLTDEGRDLFDPFGVVRVPIASTSQPPSESLPPIGAPELVRNGEADLVVAPSGGAMLLAPCGGDEAGAACVRQPDGTWRTIAIKGELAERGGGPLSDGRVAFLRGMFDGDDAEPSATRPKAQASPSNNPLPDDEGVVKNLHVSVVGKDGVEHAREPIPFTMVRGYVRVQSPIEEDLDHTLRFVIEDGDGPFAVVVPPGKEGAQVRSIANAAVARLHAGRGIAVGEGKVQASVDGGATWSEVPAPPRAIDAARAAATSYDEPSMLAVSELGAKVGAMLRLGWGPADATSEPGAAPTRADARTALTWYAEAGAAPQVLTCRAQRGAGGTPLVAAPLEVRALLGGKPAPKTAGTRHESSLWSTIHGGMLDPVALFEEDGTDARDAGPARWTLRWYDPFEIGARSRAASIPVPKGASWTTTLRYAAASGDRALVALRSGSRLRLVRIKAGRTESVEVSSDVLPTGDVVFGSGRSDAIAWLRDAQVFVWLPGERPRAIARVAGEAPKTLGSPTAAGVPLLIAGVDWSLQRVLPVPPIEKNAAVLPPPARPSLDGWLRLPPLPQRLDALPACGAKNADPRFLFRRAALGAEVDGVAEKAGYVVFDVRVRGAEACVAGLTATLAPDRRQPRTAYGASASTAPAFVRVDLAGDKAEGGDRGLAPAAVSHRLECGLGATGQPRRGKR